MNLCPSCSCKTILSAFWTGIFGQAPKPGCIPRGAFWPKMISTSRDYQFVWRITHLVFRVGKIYELTICGGFAV